MLRHSGLLPAADGMALIKAINRLAQQAPRDPDTGERDPYPARCADALRALVGARIAADTDQDRATVVVHVDGSALDGGAGSAHLEAGPGIAVETAKRMLCDGRLQVVAEDENGHPVAIGTTQRTLSPHLARVLRATHEGCAFFGCDNDLFIEFHHMEPHAAGGPTTLDNMIPTCAPHHRLVHEYGWTIQRGDGGAIHIFRPDGTEFLRPLPHLDPGVREHIMRRVPTLQRRADRPAYHRRE